MPLVALVQFSLIISLALLTGAVTPFIPDLKIAITNGMQILFFISGVFFNINDAAEPMRSYLFLNPMAGIIVEYRNALLMGTWPDLARLGNIFLFSILMGVVAMTILVRMDRKYGKVRFRWCLTRS